MSAALAFVDADVHATPPSIDALLPYLPVYWREQVAQTGFKGPPDRWYPPGTVPHAAGAREFLGRPGLEAAVLHCDSAVESLHNPDAAAAIASALNEWLAAEWLSSDPRLRASITVPSPFPELAAAEIDRMAARPGFVQVLLPVRSETPYGSRNCRPIFEAAARHGLPVGLHFGGLPGNPSTPVGWPSFFLEDYAGMSGVFQTQVMSLIAGGVFDTHPDLRVVLLEGGVAWLPPMLWRFDKNWKGLRREIPWVRRTPTEYAREHLLLTTSPFDAPPDPSAFAALATELAGNLLYASDYPHDHGEDASPQAFASLPAEASARILSGNARRLYRL